MTQTWHDLLFAHWPVDAARLASKVPLALELDLYDGRAWLGIVPFRMTNVALRFLPAIPRLSAFPELNVRTYVSVGGRPGVFFFSLDAASPLAVHAARWFFHLPYYTASMRVERRDGRVDYRSRRREDPPAQLVATYRPIGPAFQARPGSLEYFLTERYCLYTVDRRMQPVIVEIHHPPWSLQPAAAEISTNTMAHAAGIDLPHESPLLHFAARQDAVAWARARVRP
ncbi:MAG TPA: DUF2071 domain-containing protein [Vicinamibacterales bacterium]|nr:DUF2071 domain-containing protein [Vicinamibacterales bacterium]